MTYMPGSNGYHTWSNMMPPMSQEPSMMHGYSISPVGYSQSLPSSQGLTIKCHPDSYGAYTASVGYPGSNPYTTYATSHSPASTHETLSTASYSPAPSDGYVSPASIYAPQNNVLESTRCHYKDCASTGKFKRRTDLDRHIRTQHEADKNRIDCSHGWCGRTGKNGFSRRDHLREHLREVHREDIPYKTRRASNSRSPTKAKHRRSSGSSNKASLQASLAQHH